VVEELLPGTDLPQPRVVLEVELPTARVGLLERQAKVTVVEAPQAMALVAVEVALVPLDLGEAH
jgi:hypothetical protein